MEPILTYFRKKNELTDDIDWSTFHKDWTPIGYDTTETVRNNNILVLISYAIYTKKTMSRIKNCIG